MGSNRGRLADCYNGIMKPGDIPATVGPVWTDSRLSKASAGRLSLYLRHLQQLQRTGTTKVSSSLLGDAIGITDAQVRKDLANLGNLGQPGIGYNLVDLIAALRHKLGIDRPWAAVLVGVGNLAKALLRYRGFSQHGFSFVALFDSDLSKVGSEIDGLKIHGMNDLARVIREMGAELALVAVPADSAQSVADALVTAGIRGIMNFAPTSLRLPTHVSLVDIDLAVQLEQLAFLAHMAEEMPLATGKTG